MYSGFNKIHAFEMVRIAKEQIDLRFKGELLDLVPMYENEKKWYINQNTRKVLNAIRDIKLNSNDDLFLVDNYINVFLGKVKELMEFTSNKKKKMEESIMLNIKNGSHLDTWENRDLRVSINSESVSVYFIYDVKEGNRIEISLDVADKSRIYNWDGKKRYEMENLGLDVCDVYGIRFPAFSVNLTKKDPANECEAVKICNYLGKEFYKREQPKELGSRNVSDELMSKIKGFYEELTKLWDEASELGTTLYCLNNILDKYLLAQCIENVKSMDILKKDNVIVITHKNSSVSAYAINNIAIKYVTFESYNGIFDYTHYRGEKGTDYKDIRYYFKIRQDSDEKKMTKEQMIEMFGGLIHNRGKIEVFTPEEWKDYMMLNDTEKDNLIETEVLSDELKAICEKYLVLKENK
jgi:hypothetical protein